MNVRYNSIEGRFEAEFSQDFQGDLQAVKEAKFHTDGPPAWIWYAPSPGIKALNRLREKKPASGLTITPEALEIYRPLAEAEAKNDAVRKQLADFKKKQKKEQKKSENTIPQISGGKGWIGPEDLPPAPAYVSSFVRPPDPDLKCVICTQPVYFYERQEPTPMCIWCEKNSA